VKIIPFNNRKLNSVWLYGKYNTFQRYRSFVAKFIRLYGLYKKRDIIHKTGNRKSPSLSHVVSLLPELPSWTITWNVSSELHSFIFISLLSLFFVLVPCARLISLPVSFWAHVNISYRIVLYSVRTPEIRCHYIFVPNLAKCWPIFKTLSLIASVGES